MPGVTRVGKDTAKGSILGTGASTVFTEGSRTSLLGDKVAPHGKPPHTSPVIVKSSTTVFAQGKGVVRKGDPATCGHAATGSSTVFSG
tara:strand:+ start:437 stop:700 length:264 start_codon:yes stop_codon:yes gene_type:complete